MTLKSMLLGAVAGLALAVAMPLAASAQDCPRGDLDARYCDTDGDLVADIPSNAADQIDPDTLIFAYTPVEDPAVYKEAWSDFLTHLEKVTGKPAGALYPGTMHIPLLIRHPNGASAGKRFHELTYTLDVPASVCAAFDWTGKKTVFLPVTFSRWVRKSDQASL